MVVSLLVQPNNLMNLLNRSSYKPLYLQISEYLRLMIENSDLKPGERVPSENELVAQYTVSRNTARLAINALISQGMVYRTDAFPFTTRALPYNSDEAKQARELVSRHSKMQDALVHNLIDNNVQTVKQ